MFASRIGHGDCAGSGRISRPKRTRYPTGPLGKGWWLFSLHFLIMLSTAEAAYQHRAANSTIQTQMRFSGTTVQPLGCRNRMNNVCGIGAPVPAVSTWIAGLSQAGLISERRPSFLDTAGVSLPADLDTAWRYAATTGSAGTSAATVRDNLYPKSAFSLEIRVAGRAAKCLQAGLGLARGCGGESR